MANKKKYFIEKLSIGETEAFYVDFYDSVRKAISRVQKKLGYKFRCKKVVGDILVTRIH